MPSLCSSIATSLPSSPEPSINTFVAVAEKGVPIVVIVSLLVILVSWYQYSTGSRAIGVNTRSLSSCRHSSFEKPLSSNSSYDSQRSSGIIQPLSSVCVSRGRLYFPTISRNCSETAASSFSRHSLKSISLSLTRRSSTEYSFGSIAITNASSGA